MTATSVATPMLIQVLLSDLHPSPLNPRKRFTPESLADLTANIQKRGEVVMPLLLRTKGKKFEIIDGERRYHSSKAAANISAVPGLVRDDLTDSDVIEFMLLTSIQKQELTPLEEAGGFKALIDSNKAKYSAGYIADRIGRSEKYVWDRMKLLDLIPILKKLLDAERILVGHAELLCKLKPEDQERALEYDENRYRGGDSGLWRWESVNLDLNDDEDEREPSAKNLYQGLKPITVKELESWIAHHVRFDVEHMAAAAPLEFAETAEKVKSAEERPGRGKKNIAITNAYRVDDDAKDPSERTYGSQSWRRADGREKTKTCEFSVLGTFVAGPGYGTTLEVCVNRDKCTTHFGKEIKDRQKNQKLRATGKGGQAAQREAVAEAKRREFEEKEEAARKAWLAIKQKAITAIGEFVEGLPVKKLLPTIAARHRLKVKTADAFVRALAKQDAADHVWDRDDFERVAKRYGFDAKAWLTEAGGSAPAAKKAKKR